MGAHFVSQSNFDVVPASLSVLALFGTAGLVGLLSAIAVALFASRRRVAAFVTLAGGLAVGEAYLAVLLAFSFLSPERTIERGAEKYFCEIDCHLAYSVAAVETRRSTRIVTLRVRFDENTIDSRRSRDVPLVPNPRLVRLVDSSGRPYRPVGAGLPPRPLRPGESYEIPLAFELPANAGDSRLLVTTDDWPTRFLIANENSLLHRKTLFRL